MTTPNFSRKPTAVPQQPQINMQQVGGGLPIPRTPSMVTSSTAKTLEPFGYQAGDPIPDGLAQRIAQMREEIKADEQAFDEANKPTTPTSVRPQKLLKLEDLSEAHKQEITQLLLQAKNAGMSPQAAPTVTAGVSPDVAKAVSHLANMAAPQSADPRIINDLAGPPAPNFSKKPPAPPLPPTPEVRAAAKAAAAEEMQAIHADPNQPTHNHEDATGAMPGRYTHCPRCAIDLSREYENLPSDEDRRVFLVAVLSQDRFRKQIPIMGGELVITYRSLTAEESKMVLQQLSYDMRAGKINSEGDYWNGLQNYRLAISVERITLRDGRVIAAVPDTKDIPYDPPEDGKLETMLVPMEAWFTKDILPQEPLRRVVGQQHRQFQRLVEALEAQAAEPSFWQGIATQL